MIGEEKAEENGIGERGGVRVMMEKGRGNEHGEREESREGGRMC